MHMARPTARWICSLLATTLVACSATRSPSTGSDGAEALLAGSEPPRAPFRGSTSFRLTQNAIQVAAVLDGKATASPLLLDSGAPMTLAPNVADELGLEAQSKVTLAGPDGRREPAGVVRIAEVEVAGHTFRNVGAVVDWVSPPNPVACLSTVGLLGASLLRTAIWQIDFHAGRINVVDDLGELPGIEYAMRLPFRRADAAGSPRVSVKLENVDDASLLVDLGFNGSVAMPAALYRRAGGTLALDTPAQRGHGAATVLGDTDSTLYIGHVPRLDLGALRLRDFPVLTGDDVSDFHVGVAFLRHFRTTIDWKNDALYLQRRDPERALYEEYPSYGFTPVLRDDHFVVGALWRDGSAARAGLRLHDRIVALDGDPLDSDFDTYCSLLDAIGLYGTRSAPIEVTVEREEEPRTFTVRRRPLVDHPDAARSGPRAIPAPPSR